MLRVKMSDSKTIMITGATSGIGLETARYLHECGYKLLLIGRNQDKLQKVVKEINAESSYVVDLENISDIKGIFSYCQDNSIKLDGLVHAAGYAINMPVRSYSLEHAENLMKLNYYAFLEMCKCFISRKSSNDGASIVALSSLSSETMLKGSVLYSASKNALNTAVTVASKEFAKRYIRVNAVMPAYVDTRMNDGLDDLIDIAEKQPFGLIPPRAIAETVEFLLSDKSKYITGSLLPVSAGMEF